MADTNHSQADKDQRSVGTDDLDRALDAALAKYAAVEPRAGLEERLLASLRAERATPPKRIPWRWTAAAAVMAAVVVAVALAWRSGQPSPPLVSGGPSTTTQAPNQAPPLTSNAAGVSPQVRRALPRVLHHPRIAITAAAEPKLDQFPSPQPLSREELALAQYVTEFPAEARLIALAQAEYEIEISRKMEEEAGSGADFGDLGRQER